MSRPAGEGGASLIAAACAGASSGNPAGLTSVMASAGPDALPLKIRYRPHARADGFGRKWVASDKENMETPSPRRAGGRAAHPMADRTEVGA